MFDFKKTKKISGVETINQTQKEELNNLANNFAADKPTANNFDASQIRVHTMPDKFLANGINKITAANSSSAPVRKSGFKRNLLVGLTIGVLVIILFALAGWFLLKTIESPANEKIVNNPVATETPLNNNDSVSEIKESEETVELKCSPENCELCTAEECETFKDTCHTEDLCAINNVSADALCPQIICKNGPPIIDESEPELTELKPGKDTDADGLSDVEEGLWGTDPLKVDTDGDGYNDGKEVLSFYSPTVSGSNDNAKLFGAKQVKIYTNNKFGYSLFYPISWQVNDFGGSGEQVVFIANSGEFVEVIISENDFGFTSAKEWYLDQNPAAIGNNLEEVLIGNWSGIRSPDKLNIYLLKNNYIYTLSYNVGLKQELSYQTTFEMMLKSFKLFEAPLM